MIRLRGRILLGAWLVLVSCEPVEEVVDHFRDLTPHEAYLASLEGAGLLETALGRDWRRAAAEAVDRPVQVPVPYREDGYLPPDEPTAVGLRFALQRGQRLELRASLETPDSARVFVELFRIPDDPGDAVRPVVTADSLDGGLVYEPYRDGEYLVRLQPELLRGGRYTVTLSVEPALAFPVEGAGLAEAWSGFGAPRDGGARDHHGVDIFAPRGTPALAASPAEVTRVQNTGRGGRVVWLRDHQGRRLYYAHLDRQLVEQGQRVLPGDTVGLVGNTGNARTTPPHLHFGVYLRGQGPQDPVPYLRTPRRRITDLTADAALLGGWARTIEAGVSIRPAPETSAPPGDAVARHTAVRVLAGTGGWYRVRLPDGRNGFLPARLTEAAERPVRSEVAATVRSLRASPDPASPLVADVSPGTDLPVLGEFGGFLYVRGPDGRRAWTPASTGDQ